MKAKKLAVLSLGLLLGASLASCGGGGTPTTSTEQTPPSATSTKAPELVNAVNNYAIEYEEGSFGTLIQVEVKDSKIASIALIEEMPIVLLPVYNASGEITKLISPSIMSLIYGTSDSDLMNVFELGSKPVNIGNFLFVSKTSTGLKFVGTGVNIDFEVDKLGNIKETSSIKKIDSEYTLDNTKATFAPNKITVVSKNNKIVYTVKGLNATMEVYQEEGITQKFVFEQDKTNPLVYNGSMYMNSAMYGGLLVSGKAVITVDNNYKVTKVDSYSLNTGIMLLDKSRTTEYTYVEGKVTKNIYKYSKGVKLNEEKYIDEYDQSGNLVKTSHSKFDGLKEEFDEPTVISEYEYNADKQMTKLTSYSNDIKTVDTITYNDIGYITQYAEKRTRKSGTTEIDIQYNENNYTNNLLTSETEINYDDGIPYLKEVRLYENGLEKSYISYVYVNNQYVKSYEHTYTYEGNDLLTEENIDYNTDTGVVSNKEKTEYTYNNHVLASCTHYEFVNNEYKKHEEETYTTDGNTKTTITTQYVVDTGAVETKSKNEEISYPDSYLKGEKRYSYNSTTEEFKLEYSKLYEIGENKKDYTFTETYYDNGNISSSSKTIARYNTSGFIIYEEEQSYDSESQTYKTSYKSETTYNDIGLTLTRVDTNYRVSGEIENSTKYNYTYDASGRIDSTKYYEYVTDDYVLSGESSVEILDNGDKKEAQVGYNGTTKTSESIMITKPTGEITADTIIYSDGQKMVELHREYNANHANTATSQIAYANGVKTSEMINTYTYSENSYTSIQENIVYNGVEILSKRKNENTYAYYGNKLLKNIEYEYVNKTYRIRDVHEDYYTDGVKNSQSYHDEYDYTNNKIIRYLYNPELDCYSSTGTERTMQ